MAREPTREPGAMCRCDECETPNCSCDCECGNAASGRDGLCRECRFAACAEGADDMAADAAMERERDAATT